MLAKLGMFRTITHYCCCSLSQNSTCGVQDLFSYSSDASLMDDHSNISQNQDPRALIKRKTRKLDGILPSEFKGRVSK